MGYRYIAEFNFDEDDYSSHMVADGSMEPEGTDVKIVLNYYGFEKGDITVDNFVSVMKTIKKHIQTTFDAHVDVGSYSRFKLSSNYKNIPSTLKKKYSVDSYKNEVNVSQINVDVFDKKTLIQVSFNCNLNLDCEYLTDFFNDLTSTSYFEDFSFYNKLDGYIKISDIFNIRDITYDLNIKFNNINETIKAICLKEDDNIQESESDIKNDEFETIVLEDANKHVNDQKRRILNRTLIHVNNDLGVILFTIFKFGFKKRKSSSPFSSTFFPTERYVELFKNNNGTTEEKRHQNMNDIDKILNGVLNSKQHNAVVTFIKKIKETETMKMVLVDEPKKSDLCIYVYLEDYVEVDTDKLFCVLLLDNVRTAHKSITNFIECLKELDKDIITQYI